MQTYLSNPQTLISILPTLSLPHLHQLHSHFLKSGLSLHTFLSSKLLAAASLLHIPYAHSLLIHLFPSPPPLFAFNSLLRSLSLFPLPHLPLTLSVLSSLRLLGHSPDHFTFIASLKISARSRCPSLGLQLHALSLRTPHYLFLNLKNALINFYCSCTDASAARQIFDEMPHSRDTISWSTLMNGYLQTSQLSLTLCLFEEMRERGFVPNATSLVCVLSACAALGPCCGTESVHGFCLKTGACAHLNVVTAVVTAYIKLGRLVSARKVFDETGKRRDVVMYNCLVDGYARAGHLDECLMLLDQMRSERIRINSLTLLGLFSACASSGALSVGQRLYGFIKEESLELDASLGTAVLDMYMKSGCVDDALEVFDKMRDRDVQAWTAMIMGLGVNGRAEDAVRMFQQMEEGGVRPNEVTFLAALNACSHGRMIDLGKDLFAMMVRNYGMSPGVKHYGCLIDLLGRAGLLDEAYELIKSLPLRGDAVAWRALLAACRAYGDVRLGEVAQQRLVDIGDVHPSDSMILSSMYGSSGKWEEIRRMRGLDRDGLTAESKKEAGYSSVELTGTG